LKLKYLFDSQEFSLRHAVRLPLRSMSATVQMLWGERR
jgi:hypothetical protein